MNPTLNPASILHPASQLEVKDVLLLKSSEIKTMVDMRPDGEAKDQPSSADMASAAGRMGLGFHYIL